MFGDQPNTYRGNWFKTIEIPMIRKHFESWEFYVIHYIMLVFSNEQFMTSNGQSKAVNDDILHIIFCIFTVTTSCKVLKYGGGNISLLLLFK